MSQHKSVNNRVYEMFDKMLEQEKNRKLKAEEEAQKRISYAIGNLMQTEPFFAILLFKLVLKPCYEIPLFGTDGSVLLYNPINVAENMLRKDIMFVLVHEVSHIFFKHNLRGPVKPNEAKAILDDFKNNKNTTYTQKQIDEIKAKHKKWNYACDYVINEHIANNIKTPSSKKLKDTLLFNDKYRDWTSEKVYKDLKDDPNNGQGKGNNSELGVGGVFPYGFGKASPQETKVFEKAFNNDVKAASISAKKAGKLPSGVAETIESLYTTSTPWQDIFRTIFTTINKQDYTFQYPNKRYTMHQINYGVIMPSLWGQEYVNVGFIMDTSGSVGPREKAILTSELKHILEDYPIKLYVLYCDTKAYVENIQVLTQDDIKRNGLTLDVKGGGGTNMQPAFDYFRKNQEKYNFETVICLTDMWLSHWNLGATPPFSVYWAMLPNHAKNVKVPFGTKINIILNEK